MRKIEVLNLLLAAPDLDTTTIARRLDATPEATGMMLVRLVRQGLLCREIDDDRLFIYNLTAKGKTRRVYLNACESEVTG